jgi:putative transposase
MKRARFTEEQFIRVLRKHEAGAKTADLARRKHGVSEATLYIGKPNTVAWTSRRPSGCGALKKLRAEQMLDAAACVSSWQKWYGPPPSAKVSRIGFGTI